MATNMLRAAVCPVVDSYYVVPSFCCHVTLFRRLYLCALRFLPCSYAAVVSHTVPSVGAVFSLCGVSVVIDVSAAVNVSVGWMEQ
jgi:hypothetical protein